MNRYWKIRIKTKPGVFKEATATLLFEKAFGIPGSTADSLRLKTQSYSHGVFVVLSSEQLLNFLLLKEQMLPEGSVTWNSVSRVNDEETLDLTLYSDKLERNPPELR
jgi:hypothetical protein